MCKLSAGRFPSHLLHDALLSGQKKSWSRRKHVLQKSQWQAESSWFQSQPSLSITAQSWSTSHLVHTEQHSHLQQPGSTAGTCAVCLILHISLQDIVSCGLWCLRKRKPFPESLQVITVTVASSFKRRKKCRRSLLPQPQPARVHAAVGTGMQIFPDTLFRHRFTSALTESIYNHTGLLLLCLSRLKVGQPGDSTPPTWCRAEAELVLTHTELLRCSPVPWWHCSACRWEWLLQQQLRAHRTRHTKTSALRLRGSTTASFDSQKWKKKMCWRKLRK